MHHAIAVTDLKKRYRVYFEKPALIKNILPFLVSQGKAQEFWALNGVSFTVGRGECVGIIGPNGSGKSTILSVLAGVTAPTGGTLSINGRVSSLLSLGAGFNFELTGQENVYLNGAILGFSKSQVDGIYKDIVDFADLGKFMNAKLSTYSSGMNMRLGFAIAVMVSFDVLIIDEILAVGDLSFQTKCFRAMKRFYEDEGKTIILVSHDLDKIGELCSRVIWFEHGRIQAEGDPSEVLKEYREKYREKYEPLMIKKYSSREAMPIRHAHMIVDPSRAVRRIPPLLFGSNVTMTSDGACFWDDTKKRLRQWYVREFLPLGLASLRFPGAHYPDFYHWREAIGTPRPLWHDRIADEKAQLSFGTDEFVSLCARMGAEPMLTVNVADGTPKDAVDWLAYCRGKGLRVKLVEIGNEPYYDEYHGIGKLVDITPAQYAERYLKFAESLRRYDGEVKLLAAGCLDTGVFRRYRYPDWNRILMEKAGARIDYLSIHNTQAPILNITPDYDTPPGDVSFEALLAAPLYVEDNLRKVIAQLREHGSAARVAVTDYRATYTDVPAVLHGMHKVKNRESNSVNWARNFTLGAAMYEAMLLNLFMRHPEVEIAHRYSIHDPIGSALVSLKKGAFVKNPQYYVQQMYGTLAGKLVLEARVNSAAYCSSAVGIIPAQEGVPYIDAVAIADDDRKAMAIILVNRSLHSPVHVKISLGEFEFRSAVLSTITGPSYDSMNESPASQNIWVSRQWVTREEITHRATGRVHVICPKHSITKMVLCRQTVI
jgi:ABC-type polysaccharide/polyol phosphate transport system ATPase subunit/alpha-L-arabinofuranosidase